MTARFKVVKLETVLNIDNDPKKNGLVLDAQQDPHHGVTLVFNGGTRKELDALAKELNRLGLTEVIT